MIFKAAKVWLFENFGKASGRNYLNRSICKANNSIWEHDTYN